MQVPTRGHDARLALATPDGANMRIITMESTCVCKECRRITISNQGAISAAIDILAEMAQVQRC